MKNWNGQQQPMMKLWNSLMRVAVVVVLVGILFHPMEVVVVVDAYRVGDVVDAAIRFDSSSSQSFPIVFALPMSDASVLTTTATTTLRSQMPKFGMTTQVDFPRNPHDTEDDDEDERRQSGNKPSPPIGFTLFFEDGLRTVEYVPLKNYKGLILERLVMTFVYSKSSGNHGMIHSVILSEKVYSKYNFQPETFSVQYQWHEEAPVRLMAGYAVLFLIVFVSSILFLLQTCILDDLASVDDNTGDGPAVAAARKPAQSYGGYRGTKDR